MSKKTQVKPGDVSLILRPLRDTVPANVRLRRLLKSALRAYGFRCVSAVIEDLAKPIPPIREDDDPTRNEPSF